jgi:murein DD-endopeptidase MepM/ murein hydrolase activator NlpD
MIDPVADQQKRAEQNFDFMSEVAPYLKSKAQQSVQKLQGVADKASDFTSDLVGTVSDALPLKGKFNLTQKFGNVNPELYSGITKGSRHLGVDLATPEGTDVFAPTTGSVNYGADKDWGNFAEMTLPGGTTVRFSHLSKIGQNGSVKAGQAIAKTGSTGNSTGAHLDISARQNGQYIDPMTLSWLNQLIGG